MQNLFQDKIYFIRRKGKAYYSFQPIGNNYWQVEPDYILPYIVEWPELLDPQTIH
jgi:hypothetical protein